MWFKIPFSGTGGRGHRNAAARWPVLVFALLVFAPAGALEPSDFDRADFARLESEEIREVEARLSEFFNAETGALIRVPRTRAEQYVINRQMRLSALFSQRPVEVELADGTRVVRDLGAVINVTRVVVDEHGHSVLECTAPPDAPAGQFAEVQHQPSERGPER